jgi:hypothetical protein
MKNYFLIAVISVIFVVGININNYSKDKAQQAEKRELAKIAKNDVKKETNTIAIKKTKKLNKIAKAGVSKADKKNDKLVLNK